MKDFALSALINRVLSAKTKGEAATIAGDVGADYSDLVWKLVNRLTFKRTLNQSSLYYKWIAQISKHTGETELEVRRYVKLIIGCKILVEEDKEFEAFCKTALKPLPYEKCLQAMDYVAVSSLMTTKQMTKYMDMIERHYRAQGVQLVTPEAA